MPTLEEIDASHFEKLVHQPFRAQVADYVGTWELIAVTPLGSPHAEGDAARTRSFSLLFRAPAEHRLPQGTYAMHHPEIGALDIFMVPIRADKDGFYLEAIFNRAAA